MSIFAHLWGAQKPPLGTQINFGHPLAHALRCALLLNEGGGRPHTVTKNVQGAWTGNPGWRREGLDFDGASNVAWTHDPIFAPTGPCTYACWWRRTAGIGGTTQTVYGKGNGSNAANTAGAHNTIDTVNRISWKWSDGTSFFQLICGDFIIAEGAKYHLTVCTWDGATLRGYLDGRRSSTTLSFPGPVNNNASLLFALGRNGTGAGANFMTGQVREFYIWDRPLAQAEIQRLFVDPYAMILRPVRWLGVLPSAGPFVNATVASVSERHTVASLTPDRGVVSLTPVRTVKPSAG